MLSVTMGTGGGIILLGFPLFPGRLLSSEPSRFVASRCCAAGAFPLVRRIAALVRCLNGRGEFFDRLIVGLDQRFHLPALFFRQFRN